MAELKVPATLTRELAIVDLTTRTEDDGITRLRFSASSEAPVERWFGEEILSHEKSAVRLDRAERGAMPLLFNHRSGDVIGMVDKAEVKDKRLMIDAHLFDTARAKDVGMMIAGGLRNVSIGYRLHEVVEEKKSQTFRATDWEPYEVSVVDVPADSSVGLGRSPESEQISIRMVVANAEEFKAAQQAQRDAASITSSAQTATTPKESQMEVKDNAQAGATADVKISAVEAEKERRQAIINLCKSNKIDARVEARWIEDGTALHQVANELLDVMEERSKHKPASAAALGLSNKETQNYSLFRAIRAMRFGQQDRRLQEEAAFEIECSRAVAKQLGRAHTSSMMIPSEVLTRPLGRDAATQGLGQRAMATTPGSKGGYLVNVENMGFIDILRNRSVAMSMGARVISGLVGNVTFPRQTGKVTVTWQAGEGTSITAADQALGQLSMTPKTCIAITDVSEQLLAQSSPSAEAFVMADLAADVAIDGVDYATINGTGGAQPLGIKNTTGVTTGQDAASVTYAKIRAFVSTAGASNAIRGNPGWVTTTAGASALMGVQRFTSTDTPIWEGNMLDGSVIGFRAMSSEQLASANLIFGSWDELVIGEWGVLELSTDNGGTRFNTAQVGIRAMWMVDVMLRYPQAFVVSTNLS